MPLYSIYTLKLRLPLCIYLLVYTVHSPSVAQIKLCTWNACNMGKSKSAAELEYMAQTLRHMDIVALQEVSTSDFGARAVAALAEALNRKGSKWDYMVSDPTRGPGSERYAFLWKTSKVSLRGRALSTAAVEQHFNREPFCLTFSDRKSEWTVCSFHAVPKTKNPAWENSRLYLLDSLYADKHLIVCGDFNLDSRHIAFESLSKRGFVSAFVGQKTSLKMKCLQSDCLANEYDNIWLKKNIPFKSKGTIHFYASFADIKEARQISDHIPIWVELDQP